MKEVLIRGEEISLIELYVGGIKIDQDRERGEREVILVRESGECGKEAGVMPISNSWRFQDINIQWWIVKFQYTFGEYVIYVFRCLRFEPLIFSHNGDLNINRVDANELDEGLTINNKMAAERLEAEVVTNSYAIVSAQAGIRLFQADVHGTGKGKVVSIEASLGQDKSVDNIEVFCNNKNGGDANMVYWIGQFLDVHMAAFLEHAVRETVVNHRVLALKTLAIQTSKMDLDSAHTSTTEPGFAADMANGIQALGISDEADFGMTCFSHTFNDILIHFQIIRLPKQIYAWIGCNSGRLGCLYAAAPTRPNNIVSVTCLLGGTSDNTGSGIARRIVLKTGLPVTLACNIPKDSPMLEAEAEKKLVQKLISLGYTEPTPS